MFANQREVNVVIEKFTRSRIVDVIIKIPGARPLRA